MKVQEKNVKNRKFANQIKNSELSLLLFQEMRLKLKKESDLKLCSRLGCPKAREEEEDSMKLRKDKFKMESSGRFKKNGKS